MSVESTRAALDRYFNAEHNDVTMIAEDVVFTVMGTGVEHHGREGLLGMLHYLYHVAFDANAEERNRVIEDQKAIVEFAFIGKHIGEFAGVPPTGKNVNVPLCVAYDLENDMIKRGRVYFETPAFLQQVGALPPRP
jgi:steroid delta-isomerase-like uncharacterized protein